MSISRNTRVLHHTLARPRQVVDHSPEAIDEKIWQALQPVVKTLRGDDKKKEIRLNELDGLIPYGRERIRAFIRRNPTRRFCLGIVEKRQGPRKKT